MRARRIVVTDHSFPSLTHEETAAASSGAEIVDGRNATAEDDVAAVTTGADVVLLTFAEITDRVLAGLAPDAVVIRYGIGVDTIDVDAATRRGIRVCNVPDYGADTVADHTIALALAVLRRVVDYHREITGSPDGWVGATAIGAIPALSDLTYGLVGTGQIGRKVAARIRAFGSSVIAYDPYADAGILAAEGIRLVGIEELLARADVISVHAPLTRETTHLIDADAIARMKRTAILVNTARGALVDTVAAAEAVSSGRLGGLGLDVFEREPLEHGHALRTAPRTLLTPHAAFYSETSLRNLQRLAAEEAGRALRGEPLRCAVNG
ncbi:C-terminal binding protein [Microbacterium resistens]|uniref:C-terminal binding protein n=1 Tax=Microbacterium resistens TaxID=156977 RepID=UPI00082FF7D0|nr:C-terminal binding protein [Microbacterium resistens]MBW1639155.1 C-terminal binding protein [Microbacterium resistens]